MVIHVDQCLAYSSYSNMLAVHDDNDEGKEEKEARRSRKKKRRS